MGDQATSLKIKAFEGLMLGPSVGYDVLLAWCDVVSRLLPPTTNHGEG